MKEIRLENGRIVRWGTLPGPSGRTDPVDREALRAAAIIRARRCVERHIAERRQYDPPRRILRWLMAWAAEGAASPPGTRGSMRGPLAPDHWAYSAVAAARTLMAEGLLPNYPRPERVRKAQTEAEAA